MNWRRWWAADWSAIVWIVFFLAVMCGSQRVLLISADGDACWHWRQGNWMLENRAVLRADEFSHTRFGAPVIEMWWLSEIIFAIAGNALGWFGVVLVSALLIATTLWLLHRQLVRVSSDAWIATGLTLLAAGICATHWLARPHLFTHLLTVVFAGMLRSDLTVRQLCWRLVPLMVLWANLHGAFVTGLVLIAVHAVGNWRLLILLGACGLGSLLNPHGWNLHWHVLDYLRNPVLVDFVQEYAAPKFSEHVALAIMIAALVGVAVALRPNWTIVEWLLIGVFGFFALRHARNAPTFALVVIPLLAVPIAKRWQWRPARVNGGAGWIAATVAVILVVGPRALPVEIPVDKYPVAGVRFLRDHPDRVHGEMFNDVLWGGYLMWALPERRVFVDGRIDFYGTDLINDFNVVDELRTGYLAVLDKYQVGWTILPNDHRLNRELAQTWSIVYTDAVTTILSRPR